MEKMLQRQPTRRPKPRSAKRSGNKRRRRTRRRRLRRAIPTAHFENLWRRLQSQVTETWTTSGRMQMTWQPSTSAVSSRRSNNQNTDMKIHLPHRPHQAPHSPPPPPNPPHPQPPPSSLQPPPPP